MREAQVEPSAAVHGMTVLHRRYGPSPTVVVGGGAAGLELVARLMRTQRAHAPGPVVLVDRSLGHLWKPRLHEVATAMQSPVAAETSYLGHSRIHGYHFEIGALDQIDPAGRRIQLAALVGTDGEEVLPARWVAYGRLVLALGSEENDFNTPGAQSHCMFLNSTADAVRIRDALLTGAFRVARGQQPTLALVIIGGGATGVELCAQIHGALDALSEHEPGLDRSRIRLTLVEGAQRLLSTNPVQVSSYAARALEARGVEVVLNDRVASVCGQGVLLRSGRRIEAQLRIWTAGIQGPRVLQRMPALPKSRSGRVTVDGHLRCSPLAGVYAIGDCAEWIDPATGAAAPYTAQVASAQAKYLARALLDEAAGRTAAPFSFRSAGAIVSLGDQRAAGNLTTRFGRHSREQIVQGLSASWLYALLYRRHELAVHGWRGALARLIGERLATVHEPRLKLH